MRHLIFDEDEAKWLVSGVRVNRSWSPKGSLRQLVEVSNGRRLHDGCDDRPSPFHGHSKGSKRDGGGALLPACTALLDKRRLRHAMQNDPIIAAGETGILDSRDEGATLIRILLARDGEATGAGRVVQGNAAARCRKFGYAVRPSNPSRRWLTLIGG